MGLQKQTAEFNFSKGINTKSDPFQIPIGKLADLKNAVFSTTDLLSKRNGYAQITALPDLTSQFLCTFNEDLIAIGDTLQSYSQASQSWQSRGTMVSARLDVLPAIRTSTNQTQVDCSVAPNGVSCIVYADQDPASLSAKIYKYCIIDSITGVYIVSPTTIANADASTGNPRVFLLSSYFIIVYSADVAGTAHLDYISVSISDPTMAHTFVSITSSYTPEPTLSFDGVVFNNALYLAWNAAADTGIKMCYLTNGLVLSSTINPDAIHVGTMISVCADSVNQQIWVSYYDLGGTVGYTLAVDFNLVVVLAATLMIPNGTVLNLISSASSGTLSVFYEVSNNYSYDSSVPTHFIKTRTCTIAGVRSTAAVLVRSVGLASKTCTVNSIVYFLTVYSSTYQSTYFLCDSSGNVVSKFAYQNACGYLTLGLPSITVTDNIAVVPYLYKFSIASVNKSQNAPAGGQNSGVYAQQGINLATLTFDNSNITTAELGRNLFLTGGLLWAYDGNILVEQNFHLWPDLDLNLNSNGSSKSCTFSSSGGSITTQNYFYIAIYEWQDIQGNIHRSGVSIQIPVNSSDLTGSTNTITVNVPTLRLTYKISNPVKIVLFRASTAQTTFYQVTSISTPTLNSISTDSVAIADTLADSSIIGNSIIYTNGGVLENTGGQACHAVTIFDNRLFIILAEDPNSLAYSQIVIDQVPVEMSLNLTRYISPTIGSEGSTGDTQTFNVMDDKLILFKANAMYYMNGSGPDATGSNNQYSEPIFITSVVGCSNHNSIVFTPSGLMFQSTNNLGIWLLSRDLSTKYIGSDVQAYNEDTVLSSTAVPGTTYVLFTLDSGITLMYDYYYDQWGTFTGIPNISSILYQGLHTFINSQAQVYQETDGVYLDGSNPVLMNLETGWINLAGLQGYQRAYWLFLLGNYLSPHKIQMSLAYDYNDAILQAFTITPVNTNYIYGNDATYGAYAVYGGAPSLEQWRINLLKQKCQSFKFTLQELYDPSAGIAAGAGFTLSGCDIAFGYKKGYPRLPATQSIG